jgi:hypothetical protein
MEDAMHRINDKGQEEKQCTSCKAWLLLENFGRRADLEDGLQCYCKDCVRKANANREDKKSEWASSQKWLDNYAKEYCRKHPVDNWMMDKLFGQPSMWDGVPAALMVKELRR